MFLIDIKIIAHLLPSDHINAIDATIFTVMHAHANGTLSHQGTTVATGLRDWIYVVPDVENDVRLLDALKLKLVAALGRNVTVESYEYLDAYPGDAAMWGYAPGALVLNRR